MSKLRHQSRSTSSGTTSTDLTDGRQPQDVTSHPRPARDAQNAQIRTASIATGIEPYSGRVGGGNLTPRRSQDRT